MAGGSIIHAFGFCAALQFPALYSRLQETFEQRLPQTQCIAGTDASDTANSRGAHDLDEPVSPEACPRQNQRAACSPKACPHQNRRRAACSPKACPHQNRRRAACSLEACPRRNRRRAACSLEACPHQSRKLVARLNVNSPQVTRLLPTPSHIGQPSTPPLHTFQSPGAGLI
jgi:hypothetical protein